MKWKEAAILGMLIILGNNCIPKKKEKDPLKNPIVLLGLSQALAPKPTTCDKGKVDTYFSKQWHLENKGDQHSSAITGEDARVKNVWNSGNRGDDILIAVVDDGLDEKHEDLKEALSSTVKGLSYSYTNPYLTAQHASNSSAHGTAVGGVAAGRGGNGIGISGAAPCAQLVGRGILEVNASNEQVAEATTKDGDKIHISNNSWGAADNTGQFFPSNSTWQAAIEEGLSSGRSGKGTIYMWAAGNGGKPSPSSTAEIDNSNYDGQANFYGVIAVCGVGINGKRAFYSEKGANLWVCAHTQGDNGTSETTAITTTDPTGNAGYNSSTATSDMSDVNYTQNFNGTSSATPLAAGVVALVLKANPNLGWRDVKEILAQSARKNDSTDSDWKTNNAGFNINHKYGFGTVDAESAVNLAKSWTPITSTLKTASTSNSSIVSIPDNNTAGTSTTVSLSTSITKIEFVDVEVTSNHTNHGDLTFTLTAPSNTQSVLSEKHVCLNGNSQVTCNGFTGGQTFRFGTARHLGENPNGTWTLKAVDDAAGDTGSFSFKIKVYGREN